ncbi:MAG: hypothetical protein ACSLEN_13330 [Candidatus Malihini olakiniferum]
MHLNHRNTGCSTLPIKGVKIADSPQSYIGSSSAEVIAAAEVRRTLRREKINASIRYTILLMLYPLV